MITASFNMQVDANERQEHLMRLHSPTPPGLLREFTPLKSGLLRDFTPLKCEQLCSPSPGLFLGFTPLKCKHSEMPCHPEADADEHVSLHTPLVIVGVEIEKDGGTAQEIQDEVGVDNAEVVNDEATTCSDTSVENHAMLDQESLFFMGDEVGEMTLGYHERVGDDDCLLGFQIADAKIFGHDHKPNLTIRRTVAKSISLTNRMVSPTGVDSQFQNDFDWIEQQQIYRRQSFQPKSVDSVEFVETESPTVKGERLSLFVEISHSSMASEPDVCDTYPDTPSHSNSLKFLEVPDIASPTPRRVSDHQADRSEVKTSLPEPDSLWFNSFFGAEQRSKMRQARINSARKGSIRLMSRLSAFSFPTSRRNAGVAPLFRSLRLDDILSVEELLALGGYKDFRNGLAQC